MPQALIYLNEEENDRVEQFSKLWNLSKAETIKRMLREFKEHQKGKKAQ